MAGYNFYNRRKFLKNSVLTSGALYLASKDLSGQFLYRDDKIKLTILHTNDVHSHIDAFPLDDKKYPGLGGAVNRANLIDKIRKVEKNVILLDAGDIFQGTPYFNFFGGEIDFKIMSEMKYEAATMGNHDFDNGMDGFGKMLPFANFPFICSNYDFEETLLKNKTKPYHIIKIDELEIGIIGVGIELDGLVDQELYGSTKYLDPVKSANHYAHYLKKEKKCDLVICLSHLGYRYESSKVSDIILANQSEHIDLIIGGHTHTFLPKAVEYKNRNGEIIVVNQVGWAGLNLGRIDFYFNRRNKKDKDQTSQVMIIRAFD